MVFSDKPKEKHNKKNYCTDCFTVLAKGVSHKRNLTSRLQNLTDIIMQSDPKLKDQLVSTLIKEKSKEEADKKIISLTQARGGQPLTIAIGASNVKKDTKKLYFLQKIFVKCKLNII